MSWLNKLGFKKKEKLTKGVEKSREGLLSKISKSIAGKDRVDADNFDQLEDALITSDVGVRTTIEIINRLEARVVRDKFVTEAELQKILQEKSTSLLTENSPETPAESDADSLHKPHATLVVGGKAVGNTAR